MTSSTPTPDRPEWSTGDGPAQPSQPSYAPPPGQVGPGPRRLTRPRSDRMLGGVCAGLARYAKMDPTMVRALTVLVGLVTFPVSILAYVVLWMVIPEE